MEWNAHSLAVYHLSTYQRKPLVAVVTEHIRQDHNENAFVDWHSFNFIYLALDFVEFVNSHVTPHEHQYRTTMCTTQLPRIRAGSWQRDAPGTMYIWRCRWAQFVVQV